MSRPLRSPFRVIKRDGSPFYYVQFTIPPAARRYSISTGETEPGPAGERATEIWKEKKRETASPDSPPPSDGTAVPARVVPDETDNTLVAVVAARCHAAALAKKKRRDPEAPESPFPRDLLGDLKNYIVPRWTRLSDITAESWDDYREVLRNEKHDLKFASIKRIGKHLRHLLKFAVAQRYMSKNDLPVIQSPTSDDIKSDTAPRRDMPPHERDLFLEHIRERCELIAKWRNRTRFQAFRPYRVYRFLFETGWRKSAVMRLRFRMIRWPTEPGGQTLVEFHEGTLKNKEKWIVPLSEEAVEAIKEELAGSPSIDPGRLVFPGNLDYSNIFKYAVQRLGLDPKGLTPHHVARHSLATELGATPGVSNAMMKAVFGWKSNEMVDRYTTPARTTPSRPRN